MTERDGSAVSVRKSLFPIFIYAFILVWLACSFDLSLGQEQPPGLSLYFDKPSYNDSESFLATVWVTNHSAQPLQNVTLTFEIRSREYPPPGRPTKRTPKAVLKTTLPQPMIRPGVTRLEIGQSLPELAVSEGIYPVAVTLSQRRKVLTQLDSYLTVVNSRVSPPLLLALVWNVHEPAHFDPDGNYLDEEIARECRDDPDSPGAYTIYTAALAKHAQIQTNMNISPILLQQLNDLADGYALKRDQSVVQVSDTSQRAADVRRVLREYERLIKGGQLELIPSPYAYPYLPDLTERGWTDDINAQILEGKKVTKEVLNLDEPPPGMYPAGLAVSQSAVPLIAKSGVKYLVLAESSIGLMEEGVLPLLEPVVLEEDRSRLLVFVRNEELSAILQDSAGTEAISQKLIAKLATVYLNQPEMQKIIIIASPVEGWHPSPALLETLYSTFEQTAWLKTTTLASAYKSFPTADKKIEAKPPARPETTESVQFFQKLDLARRDRLFFSSLLSADNPLKQKLEDDLLVAEGSDWPEKEDSLGQRFAEKVSTIVRGELAKVSTAGGTKITLTNETGKVRVAFFNNTGYVLRARITLSGQNFSFPEGGSREVSLRPKENVYDFQIKTKKTGEYPLKVTLHKDKRVIAETIIRVRSTYFDRVSCALGIFISLFAILAAVRQLRRRQIG